MASLRGWALVAALIGGGAWILGSSLFDADGRRPEAPHPPPFAARPRAIDPDPSANPSGSPDAATKTAEDARLDSTLPSFARPSRAHPLDDVLPVPRRAAWRPRGSSDSEADGREKEDDPRTGASGDEARDPRTLSVLAEIIDLNGLDDSTSIFDGDDGDGRLGPEELGRQQWRNGQLIALDLSSRHAYRLHALPESLAELRALELLDLEGNRLEALPWSIGQLRSLVALHVRRNRLVSLPASIGDLRALEALDAGENHLVGLPDSLGDLISLRELRIGNNPYARLPHTLIRLSRLELLDVGQHYEPARPNARAYVFPGIVALPADLDRLPSLSLLSIEGTRFDCVGGGPSYLWDGSIENIVRSSSRPCTGQPLADRLG